MSIWSKLSQNTHILFREPVIHPCARIVKIDGKYEVIRPLGLPVRIKRGVVEQKRFATWEQAEKVKIAWEKQNFSKKWKEVDNAV